MNKLCIVLCIFLFSSVLCIGGECEKPFRDMYDKQINYFKGLKSKMQVDMHLRIVKSVNGKEISNEERYYSYAHNGNLFFSSNNVLTYKIGKDIMQILPLKKTIVVRKTISSISDEKRDILNFKPENIVGGFLSNGKSITCRDTAIKGKIGYKVYQWSNKSEKMNEKILWVADPQLNLVSVEIIKETKSYSTSEMVTFIEPIRIVPALAELYSTPKSLVYSSDKKLNKKFEGYYVYFSDND